MKRTAQCLFVAYLLVVGLSAQGKTPAQLLKEAANRWEGIHDYSATFRQTNIETGTKTVFLGKISFCRRSQDNDAYLRLDYYNTKDVSALDGPDVVQAGTLQDQYFSDGRTLWHYKPAENRVTIDSLSTEGPFPEILLLAGFLKLDLQQFRKTHTFKPLETERIGDRETYKLTIEPKGNTQEIEPLRNLWLDKDSMLPVRVATGNGVGLLIEISTHKVNQRMSPESLMIRIPSTVECVDLRRPEDRGKTGKSNDQVR